MVHATEEFRIEIDLSEAQRSAELARDLLIKLRTTYNLSKWEYTQSVRIAPLERPYSHPVLTLNSRNALNDAADAFLSEYLHEQVHWALTLHRERQTQEAINVFSERYPNAHSAPPETASDEFSTYLHLVVNYLEIEAVAEYLGRERAKEIALNSFGYRWMYRTVIEERAYVRGVLEATGVLPLPAAA